MRITTVTLGAVLMTGSAAIADVYVPEGELGTVLHLDQFFNEAGRIEGLDNASNNERTMT